MRNQIIFECNNQLVAIFNHTQEIFKHKSNWQLQKEYWLLKLLFSKRILNIDASLIEKILKSNFPIHWFIGPSVYKKFCSGETIESALEVVQHNWNQKIYSYIGYAVEGNQDEESFDKNFNQILKEIDHANSHQGLKFIVFKPTSLGRSELFELKQKNHLFNDNQLFEWDRVKQRFDQIAERCFQKKAFLLIDAEETWIQQSIDDLTIELIKKHNKKEPIVFITVQMYRKDGFKKLKNLRDFAQSNNRIVGVKLVRGAYIEKENQRALAHGIESPICASKNETDTNFHRGIQFLMENLDGMSLFLGTHNEKSTQYCIDLMSQCNIDKQHPKIWFSQLYGMSEHISFGLASQGYKTVKYIPYGPLKEIIPYLLRRAQENSSVIGHASRDIDLLKQELKRRYDAKT